MSTAKLVVRRIAAAVVSSGAVLVAGTATAAADFDPDCMAIDITSAESQVSTAMTGYLFTHPDVNQFFTSVQGLPKSEWLSKTNAYLAANPQTKAEIDAIRQPVTDLRNRCNIPMSSLIRGVL